MTHTRIENLTREVMTDVGGEVMEKARSRRGALRGSARLPRPRRTTLAPVQTTFASRPHSPNDGRLGSGSGGQNWPVKEAGAGHLVGGG